MNASSFGGQNVEVQSPGGSNMLKNALCGLVNAIS